MKRDYQAAVRSAVNGLYAANKEDMESALWEVLEALSPEMANLMADDEEAAHTQVNHDREGIVSTDNDEGDDQDEQSPFFDDEHGSDD